jgi:hypothetical protein
MYRRLQESSGNVLGYETRGKLTEEELGAILADMEEAIDRFGKVNLLVYVPEIPRQDLGAIGEDLEFARKHMKDVERYAVVGDSALLDWGAKLEGPLVGIQIKHFQPDQVEEAWRWLREEPGGAGG